MKPNEKLFYEYKMKELKELSLTPKTNTILNRKKFQIQNQVTRLFHKFIISINTELWIGQIKVCD